MSRRPSVIVYDRSGWRETKAGTVFDLLGRFDVRGSPRRSMHVAANTTGGRANDRPLQCLQLNVSRPPHAISHTLKIPDMSKIDLVLHNLCRLPAKWGRRTALYSPPTHCGRPRRRLGQRAPTAGPAEARFANSCIWGTGSRGRGSCDLDEIKNNADP